MPEETEEETEVDLAPDRCRIFDGNLNLGPENDHNSLKTHPFAPGLSPSDSSLPKATCRFTSNPKFEIYKPDVRVCPPREQREETVGRL